MSDLLFIFFTISITTALIYFLYKVMLSMNRENSDAELQITSKEILEQLTILHKQKKNNIVENLAKSYLAKKPNDTGVRTILAKALYDSGKVYDAIDQIKIIIRIKPNNSDMQIFMANCYIDIEKPMKAITALKELLDNDSNNVTAIKLIAELYFKTNQKISALKMYQQLEEFLESNQEKAKNKIRIAELHIEFREFEPAIKKYEEILEIYPEDISVKKRLIETYKQISDYDSIIELSTEILEAYADEDNGLWAMNALMNIYRIMQDYQKALEYANMIKLHPLANVIEAGENVAKILMDEGEIDSSIDILKELVQKEPDNIELKEVLANAYQKNQNFEATVDVYKKILDIASASQIAGVHYTLSNVYSNWAMYLFSQNNSVECFKRFTTALQYSAENPDIYYRLGCVNKLIKNFNEAISQFKKAIEINPSNAEYYLTIAECYEDIDSVYEQKKALLESLKYNPSSAQVYFKLGIIDSIQNNPNSAIVRLKKAIELDDTFVEAKMKLALILEHVGNREEAMHVYEEILMLEPENEEVANNLKMLRA